MKIMIKPSHRVELGCMGLANKLMERIFHQQIQLYRFWRHGDAPAELSGLSWQLTSHRIDGTLRQGCWPGPR